MRNKTTFPLFILVFAVAAAAPASASAPATIPAGADANMPTAITAHVKCRVVAVDDTGSAIVLLDFDTETEHRIELDDRVKIRARSKRDFDGRKKLGIADLRPGQKVKVTYLVNDGTIRRITVLERA